MNVGSPGVMTWGELGATVLEEREDISGKRGQREGQSAVFSVL